MLSPSDFIPKNYPKTVEYGSFEWSAPSNIAVVKYWGKKKKKIPANRGNSILIDVLKIYTLHFFE